MPGKSHGQKSLAGYSPWGHKESDTTERLHFHHLAGASPLPLDMGYLLTAIPAPTGLAGVSLTLDVWYLQGYLLVSQGYLPLDFI